MSRVIVIGAGINGITAAIELRKRGREVVVVDPGPLPHPLAASTDISKAVRAAYGADEDYTALAERSIAMWRKWNEELGERLYHEVGVMFLRRQRMRRGDFEYESLTVLQRLGITIARIDSTTLRQRFPAWNADLYTDGILEMAAGYVESGRVVAALVERARSLGIRLHEGKFDRVDERADQIQGVLLQGGETIAGRIVVMAVGAWTPYVLPSTRKFFRASGQPVFHLKPRDPAFFRPEVFPVFGADISTTGYYGFPVNRDGLVKIANHGVGTEMSPETENRSVSAEEERAFREFLKSTFPALYDAPIVHTRRCFYCDSHDGHFWIDRDPDRNGLIVAAGDSGHGFKFAPVLGELIADCVERKPNPLLEKFRWRPEVRPGEEKEAARFQAG